MNIYTTPYLYNTYWSNFTASNISTFYLSEQPLSDNFTLQLRASRQVSLSSLESQISLTQVNPTSQYTSGITTYYMFQSNSPIGSFYAFDSNSNLLFFGNILNVTDVLMVEVGKDQVGFPLIKCFSPYSNLPYIEFDQNLFGTCNMYYGGMLSGYYINGNPFIGNFDYSLRAT